METNHLITRTPSPDDARQNIVVITETGYQIYLQHQAFIQEFEQTLQSGLTKEELTQFFAIAEKIKKNLE